MAARLSNLAARGAFGRVQEEEDENTDGGSEDPEEVAYRERLRRLAEEDEESVVSDPFGLNMGTRQTAASTFAADDKLSLDAQRAMEMLRRTSMAVTEDDVGPGGRSSIWTENGQEDEVDEATLKVQQARLKALAAAAQPASHVRSQLTRSAMPKPPGLADREKERQLLERQKRLSMAETAAVVAATGVSAAEIQPHIDQVIRTKVEVVESATAPPPQQQQQKKSSLIAPPPGLSKPLPPVPPPSIAAKRASVAAPPGLGKEPAVVEAAPLPPPLPQSRKSGVIETKSVQQPAAAAAEFVPPAHVSADMLKARTLRSVTQSSDVSVGAKSRAVSAVSSVVAKEDMVTLHGSVRASRPLLDVLSWRAPGLAVGWMLFAALFVLALMSKKWSSLTVWALFAIARIVFLRASGFLQRVLPPSIAKFVVVQHQMHLPGSFNGAGEIVALLFSTGREITETLLQDDPRWAGALCVAIVLGVKMNIALVVVLVVFALSMAAATYAAIPRALDAVTSKAPIVGEVLAKF